MKTVLQACTPRPEILEGQFNPEIFKASLSRVLEDYRKGTAKPGTPSLYSDPIAFFQEGTYPTQGIIDVCNNALARMTRGDLSMPAMQRLDTSFGGGKTHTLIALVHAALTGTDVGNATHGIIDPANLPQPGQLRVVGVIGDTEDVIREELDQNGNPKPNTLWWLIAKQTLTADEQAPVKARLDQPSAPGSDDFFEHLLGNQPTLIVIDEVAQYLARLEAAFPGVGAQQAAAFIMSLATYAEDKSNITVVLSLASATNAFGDYNSLIRSLQSQHGLGQEDAEATAANAQSGLKDVVERSSAGTTPVQQGDLSKIMAKRLFTQVDHSAAEEVARTFIETYQKAGSELPSGANSADIHDKLLAHYPFHPTLIEFLSQDLAQVEEFQGTRGLLRTLARAVRRIWDGKLQIPLIQTGHIDLSDNTIRTELLGKTGNSDLRPVLDADITKPADSEKTGNTIAEELDQENPHPDGYPVTEWSWRVVFLHSLIGRAGGLQDEKFGIDMASAVFEMASPQIPPATVRSTLEAIAREANYLRDREGRLYADTKPTLNNLLRRIENSVGDSEISERIDHVVRGLIGNQLFDVRSNIISSEDIPDNVTKPQLGVLSFQREEFRPEEFIEKRGDAPRQCQNLVFLLAPSTAKIEDRTWSETQTQQQVRTTQRLFALARKALAVEKLGANPEAWGVAPDQLNQGDFREYRSKIPKDLETAVQETYRILIYPGKDGGMPVVRNLTKGGSGPMAGGSGGIHLEDAITQQLMEEGELITRDRATTNETLTMLGKLFFETKHQVNVTEIQTQFQTRRSWPILETPHLLADIIRNGADRGVFCLGHMPEKNAHKPDVLYHRDNPVPIHEDPIGKDWIVCTREHAKKLGWIENIAKDPNVIAGWIEETIETQMQADANTVQQSIESDHDKVDPAVFHEQMDNLLTGKKLVAYPQDAFDEEGNPDPGSALYGDKVPMGGIEYDQVKIVPMHIAQERGWIQEEKIQEQTYRIDGGKAEQLLNLLAGTSLKDSSTEIRSLRLNTRLADKSTLALGIQNTTVGALTENRELFAALKTKGKLADGGRLDITVGDAEPQCKFVQALAQFGS